jgi:hypothetical protein
MAKTVENLTENTPPGIAPVQPVSGVVRAESVRAIIDIVASVWGWQFPLSRAVDIAVSAVGVETYTATTEVVALADDAEFLYAARLRELING